MSVAALIINEDRLPHDRAVWRDPAAPPPGLARRQVSVEYHGGLIEQTTSDKPAWRQVKRWRYGWAPKA